MFLDMGHRQCIRETGTLQWADRHGARQHNKRVVRDRDRLSTTRRPFTRTSERAGNPGVIAKGVSSKTAHGNFNIGRNTSTSGIDAEGDLARMPRGNGSKQDAL